MSALALVTKINHVLDTGSVGALISARLAQATSDAPQPLRRISAEYLATRGKQIRGKLAFQSTVSFGADFSKALNWAASVELLHNASLIHDDICDGDSLRRGKQTVNRQHGEAIAICLGDYYIATGFSLALQADPQTIPIFSDSVISSIGGQASEFVSVGYPSWTQYRDIAVQKTAPLLSLPIIGAGIVAGFSMDRKSIKRYFTHTATCFQIINDLDDYFKSVGSLDPCSDLAGCRPNAVIACFRDTLPSTEQASFDNWNDEVRSAAEGYDIAQARQWWQKVKQSQALTQAVQHLDLHFKAADRELCRLPAEVQAVLTEFHRWLSCELEAVQNNDVEGLGH